MMSRALIEQLTDPGWRPAAVASDGSMTRHSDSQGRWVRHRGAVGARRARLRRGCGPWRVPSMAHKRS